MRSGLKVVAVAVLIVFAGCTGVNPLGGGDSASEPNDTAGTNTPESEGETDDLEISNETSPPGMAINNSVENVSALLASHHAELRSLESYRLIVDREQRNRRIFADISVDNRDEEYEGEEGGSRLYYTDGAVYTQTDDETVTDREVEFQRIHRGGTELIGILEGVNLTVENRTTIDDTPVVRYRVTGFDRTMLTNIQDLTGYVRIAPDGLVSEISLDVTGSSGETLKQHYAILGVNDTTVETPDWFEENQENRDTTQPQLTASFDFVEDGVTITHQGGESVSSLQVRYTAGGESVVETWDSERDITVGASYTTERAPDPGTEVRVIWSEGDQSAVLAEETAPE